MKNIILIFLNVFLLTGTLAADDWYQWRGPDRNSISKETAWNPKGLNKAKINWKINIGEGYSTVSVKGGRLYTMGSTKTKNVIYCLNVKTGKEIWTHSYESIKGEYEGPKSTPVLDGDKVYTLGQTGYLLCHNADTGKIIWKKSLTRDFRMTRPRWFFSSSVRIHEDMLLLNAGTSGLALNKNTGKPIWTTGAKNCNYSSPVIYKQKDKLYMAIFGESKLYGIELKTGKKKWSYTWKTTWDVNAADPIVFDDKIFISSGYNKGCALLDISSGKPKKIWQNENLSMHFGSAIYINGYIYGNDGNTGKGYMKCIDSKTGNVKWEKKLGFSSVISANGYLIILNEKGSLYIAEVNPNLYKEVSKREKLLPKLCWTMPVLANGAIYCRNDHGDLVSINVSR